MSDALEAAARRAVDFGIDAGAISAEVYAQDQREVEIRVYERSVESLTEAGSRGLGIRALASEGRTGYAFGTSFTEEDLRDLARRAVDLALSADPDPFGGLPSGPQVAAGDDLVAPDFECWSTEQKVDLAIEIDGEARAHDPRVSQVEQTVYSDQRETIAIFSSEGIEGSYRSSGAFAYSSAFAGEGEDLMTGLGLGIARGPGGLDAAAIGGEAAERAVVMIGARRTSARKAPVVLDEFTAASFVGLAASALSGEAVLRGRSPFVGMREQSVASEVLTLLDDGLIADGPASAPFDGEGVARRVTGLIAGGRIENLLLDSRTARESGEASTGSARRSSYRGVPSVGPSNVLVAAGKASLEDLLAEAGDGLYVTNVVGLHSGVNPVSGQFSVGASGIEIKGGKLAGPVREATIASDLITMLKGVRAVGAQRRWIPFGGSVLTGPLLVEEMTIA